MPMMIVMVFMITKLMTIMTTMIMMINMIMMISLIYIIKKKMKMALMEITMLATTMKIVLTMMTQYKPSSLMSRGERTIGASTTMRVRQNFQMLRTGRALTSLPQSAPPATTSLMVYSEARNSFFHQPNIMTCSIID